MPYLVALERGDIDALPQGTFRTYYHSEYRSFLGLPPTAEDLPTQALHQAAPPQVAPTDPEADLTGTIPRHEELPTLRLIASGFAVTLLVVLGLRVGSVVMENPAAFGFGDDAAATESSAQFSTVVMSEGTASGGPKAPSAAPSTASTAIVSATADPTARQRVHLRAIEDVRVSVETDEGSVRRGIVPGGDSFSVATDGPISLEISDLTRVVVRYNGKRIEPLHNLSKGRRLVFVPEETE
jgi:cytoskeletal protein RodZ